MDEGAWWATVHGSQSRTQLSDFTFTSLCVCSSSLCLLHDAFSPLIFSVIVDIYVPIVILLFWFTLDKFFFSFPFLYSSLVIW